VSARIGIIGIGTMGAAHLRTLAGDVADAQVVAVSDADLVRARAAAAAVPGLRVLGDPNELIEGADVDAVVIASSDSTHEAFVLACVAAGKPVLCEKPLATTAEASLRVVEAEAALGRRLVQVGFMRRFDRDYAAVKHELDDGRLGGPLLVHCAHRNSRVPATYTSEMLITSSMTHEIDVARWLIDDEVAITTVYRPRPTSRASNGMQDPQFVVLEMQSGVLVDVEIFVNAGYGYDIRCELVGETGTASLPAQVAAGFLERFAAAYRQELRDWGRALANGAPTGPSAWDGYAASAVADACLKSLTSGRPAAVRLAPRPDLYD
jgi:myo-inositol 2-dehydrogenase / D-chiro-inositol 1-dehydrogenase